jgi:formylglycine-generating enzyme required for sulfatase activity
VNLTPEIIKRLVSLKSLLDLGDLEMVSMASSRLEGESSEPEVAEILDALRTHRYAEAANRIEKLLSEGTRVAIWTDPEIALLESELERVKADLADFETEQAELEHLMSRFQAAHNEALGGLIRELLQIRMQILEWQRWSDPKMQAAFEQAKSDFEEFERDQEIQEEADRRTHWQLSDEEKSELKSLFRKVAKLCHPDVVPKEHHDAAADMFRQLSGAHQRGDLARVRQLFERSNAGLFDANQEFETDPARKKERLRAMIDSIRESVKRTHAVIQAIKESSSYQTTVTHTDWSHSFEKQAKLLAQEIEDLKVTLEELRMNQPEENPYGLTTSPSGELFRSAEQGLELANRSIDIQTGKADLSNSKTLVVPLGSGVVILMKWCPAGSFLMGSREDEEGRGRDENQVQVTLSQGFWMAQTHVTQVQWQAVMGNNPSHFRGGNLPVEQVNWYEAQEFVSKINANLALPDGMQMTLPTEAQWEYAARAGEAVFEVARYKGCGIWEFAARAGDAGPFSGVTLDEVAWYDENSEGKPHPVGTKKPNAWGLHDMHGNLWEWCADWYEPELKGGLNPQGPPTGAGRVVRGGSWGNSADRCRAAFRYENTPTGRNNGYIGFRIARISLP